MCDSMETKEFDKAVVAAVFQQAGLVGWRATTLVEAAQSAGIDDLARLRLRFPGRTAVLLRFGVLADQAALEQLQSTGSPRERVFDLLMARFDALQQHRGGVLALLTALRTDPALAALLWTATLRSMRWMLDAAGVPTAGVAGVLRVNGLGAVWAYALRAWERDEGADLPATMAAMDRALDRAMQAEEMLPGRSPPMQEPLVPDPLVRDPLVPNPLPPDPLVPDLLVPDPMPPDTLPPGAVPDAAAGLGPVPVLPGSDVAAAKDGPAVL